MGHQNQVIRQSYRSDHEIVWANRRTLRGQIGTNMSIGFGSSIVERQAFELLE
jgi:hypothetical protein